MTEVQQTFAALDEKPRRETASAFAWRPSRDFEGGLLERWFFH
jgi:hypothetical protein